MTIDTEINLPPLPGALVDVETEARAYARAAVEADRADHLRDAAKMVPSDDEILALAEDARVWVPMGSGPEKERSLQALRSLIMTALSRYSSGQPAKTVKCAGCEGNPAPENNPCAVCGQPAASTEPDLIRAIRELTSHLADVLPDDAWDQIDVKKWNDLTRHVGIAELAERRAKAAPVAQEPVAYLDIGAGGYMDVGTDLTDEQLAALPKGRHMLAIVGTHGVDGFTAASVAAQAQPVVNQQMTTGAQDREDAPSIWNPLTPYGVLVRALRIVAGTTLMEMSEGTGYTPSYLSGIEFGRNPVTDGVIGCTWSFLEDKGIKVPLSVFRKAADRAAKGADHG